MVPMRMFLLFVLFAVAGCTPSESSRPPEKPPVVVAQPVETSARKTLVQKADEYRMAMLADDHARLTDMTPSALLEQLGGRDEWIRGLEAIAAGLKARGYKRGAIMIGEPIEIAASGEHLFGTVPLQVELQAGPVKASGLSYVVGVSADGGKTWSFVDGAGIGSNRARLLALFRDFPDELFLPQIKRPELPKAP